MLIHTALMIHQHIIASSGPDGSSGTSSLETFYYVTGCIVALAGILEGARRFFNRQRQKWTDEGEQRAEQNQAIKKNNDLLQANTTAIANLTTQLSDFVMTTRAELNGLGHRIGVLERHRREVDNDEFSDN